MPPTLKNLDVFYKTIVKNIIKFIGKIPVLGHVFNFYRIFQSSYSVEHFRMTVASASCFKEIATYWKGCVFYATFFL